MALAIDVQERADGARLRLAPGPLVHALHPSFAPAPRLPVAEATARLEAAGRPFLFFVDSHTGRGSLIYHRYDGHYGLIAPAD